MKDKEILAGTAGGTLLSTIISFSAADLLRTAVFAAIGAGVSYLVTLLMQYLTGKLKK